MLCVATFSLSGMPLNNLIQSFLLKKTSNLESSGSKNPFFGGGKTVCGCANHGSHSQHSRPKPRRKEKRHVELLKAHGRVGVFRLEGMLDENHLGVFFFVSKWGMSELKGHKERILINHWTMEMSFDGFLKTQFKNREWFHRAATWLYAALTRWTLKKESRSKIDTPSTQNTKPRNQNGRFSRAM